MRSIIMTAKQTAAYDNDDMEVIRDLMEQAQRLHEETGETVEVYTDDGIVAFVAQD